LEIRSQSGKGNKKGPSINRGRGTISPFLKLDQRAFNERPKNILKDKKKGRSKT